MKTNQQIVKQVIDYLKNNNISISTAESCTGGMLASYITSYSGVSKIFNGGVVTYSDESKIKLIDVSRESVEKYTVYSPDVAKEMAIGVRKLFNSDIGVATTGLASRHKEIKDKPIGLVYISIATKSGVECFKLNLNGNRNEIREKACIKAFEILTDIVNENFKK